MKKNLLFIILTVVVIAGVFLFVTLFQKNKLDVPGTEVGKEQSSNKEKKQENVSIPADGSQEGAEDIESGSPAGSRMFKDTQIPQQQDSSENLETGSEEVDVNSLNQ